MRVSHPAKSTTMTDALAIRSCRHAYPQADVKVEPYHDGRTLTISMGGMHGAIFSATGDHWDADAVGILIDDMEAYQ